MQAIAHYIERSEELVKLSEENIIAATIGAAELLKEVWADSPNSYQISELRDAFYAFERAVEKVNRSLKRCE